MRRPPEVKICGVTRVEDARLAAELGAAYVGLNFYAGSPRAVPLERARAIAEAVRERVRVVGVFVNAPRATIETTAAAVGLDLVQLHGDEGPEAIAGLSSPAIKVFRLRDRFAPQRMAEYADAWGFLFDCLDPRRYGGTGHRWRYEAVADLPTDKPWFLAGGLAPGGVAEAVRRSGAPAIDVCSGVESAPGVKDPGLLVRLFDEVEHGQDAT